MRIMTMCILLLLSLCVLVYAGMPNSCGNLRGVYDDEINELLSTEKGPRAGTIIVCKPTGDTSRIFMVESIQYWSLQCDDYGWTGLPYNLLNYGSELRRITDDNSQLTASCVEYCVAHAVEGVIVTPYKKDKTLKFPKYDFQKLVKENFNQVECYHRTDGLFHNGKQLANNYARCDSRGWYNPAKQDIFAENSMPQNFECRPAGVNPEPSLSPPIPIIPQPCYNLRGVENYEIQKEVEVKDATTGSAALALYCLPEGRIFMTELIPYWYLKCDDAGWYGMPLKGTELLRITDANSQINVTCVESIVNPEPFTISTSLPPIVPPSPAQDIPKPCNIIKGVSSDQVITERDGSKVNKLYCVEVGNTQKNIMIGSDRYASLSCDNSVWKGKPIGWKEGHNLVEIIDNNPVLAISCVDYTGEAPVTATPPIIPDKDICNKNNIRGVSLDQLIFIEDYKSKQKMMSDTTTRVQCKQIGNAARNIFIGSTQYWFITCNEKGWKGAPLGWQDSSDLLVITNDYEFLTMSCVEYCEARVVERVNITSELTSKDVNYEYGDFSLKENFKRVECNDQTHSLFNNGEQVNSNHAECDARGWSTSALKKLTFDISKAQHFECRNANAPEPSATTTTEQTTTITKQTTTTDGPVAAAQNSLVIICASLGGILLLAIIVIAVICVMRSSKNKETENVDNEMDTEIDVQMENRGGSEHTEAESVVSEI